MGREKGRLGVGFALGGEAEGDGHYFCFSEEESGVVFLVILLPFGEGGNKETTCYPIAASVRL